MRLAVSVAVLLGLAFTPGTSAVTPPLGTPDLSQMALRVSDLPVGAKVAKQRYVKPNGALAEYDREFKSGTARVGNVKLLELENDIEIHQTPAEAAFGYDQFRGLVSTKKGRQAFAQLFARSFASSGLGKSKVTAGKPLKLGAGDDSIALPLSVKTPLGTLRVILALHRTDRVLSFLVMAGGFGAKLPTSAARTIAKPVAQHMRDGLSPINATVPTIAGTAQVNQTLTATAGTWKNGPAKLAYQWQRCDAAGANCVAIPGATALTYVVQAGDVGATLRVTETATNAIASVTASSLQTAAVIA
jgi:hypothetical protein